MTYDNSCLVAPRRVMIIIVMLFYAMPYYVMSCYKLCYKVIMSCSRTIFMILIIDDA